jgi:O-antigen/teichoic acid export membrane protein
MIRGPLSLVALSIVVYLTDSVFWGAVAWAVTWVVVLVSYDLRSGVLILKSMPQPDGAGPNTGDQKLLLRPRWSTQTLVKLAWLALPLGVVMGLISLNTSIPRYFIEQHLGERELGIFAAIAQLMLAGNMVTRALGQSASPRLATYYATGNVSAFGLLLLKLVGIGMVLGSVGIVVTLVAGHEILTLLYQPEYAQREIFVSLMVVAGLRYVGTFLGYGMTAARYFRVQVPLLALVTGTTVLACLSLIPSAGLVGAATALVISTVVWLIGSSAIVMYAIYALRKHKGRAQALKQGAS